MSDDRLGVTEALSFALGGIIGGGIFAVLGVVAELAGPTAWIAYLIAGVVVLATGYSYVALNERVRDVGTTSAGGAVSFLEAFLDRPTAAGMVGWTLLVGYVGTVAMYAYAFGAYFGAIFGLERLLGLPSRPVLSVLVVVAFVGVNVLGVRESGLVEDLLVAVKLLIVAGFGVGGIWFGARHGVLEYGVGVALADPVGPLIAAGVAFVSFEGWQLLFYDQARIDDPVRTLRRSVFASIPIATLAYVLVAFVTLSLVGHRAIVAHPDLALALAARRFAGQVGYLLVGVAAVASTASAINATLFSTALFAQGMSADDLLPDRVAPTRAAGVPTRALLVIGALTIVFTAFGSLTAITEFASLSFLVVFGIVNLLALSRRGDLWTPIPLVGLAGTAAFLPLFVWHLYSSQFAVFVLVVAIAVVVLAVEGLYFERERLEAGLRSVRRRG
ncbi:MAG: APC family permease [Halanaeroarchaeum sp.]